VFLYLESLVLCKTVNWKKPSKAYTMTALGIDPGVGHGCPSSFWFMKVETPFSRIQVVGYLKVAPPTEAEERVS